MTDKYNGRLAYRFAEMLNEKDVRILDEILAESYVNHNPFVADGLETNKGFWKVWLSAFPDTEVIVEDALAAGDRVVGRFTYRATHSGEFMGFAPSGNRIEMRSIDIWRIENGRFVEHWDELNTLEFFGQLGEIPRGRTGARP